MWNFGLPYKLKQLIDLVAQRAYDGKQYSPLARGKANRRLYARLTVSGGYSYTALTIRSPSNLLARLVAACRCSRSSERDCGQRVESRSSGIRSELGEGQSDSGTTG